jgi:hypothetical protein
MSESRPWRKLRERVSKDIGYPSSTQQGDAKFGCSQTLRCRSDSGLSIHGGRLQKRVRPPEQSTGEVDGDGTDRAGGADAGRIRKVYPRPRPWRRSPEENWKNASSRDAVKVIEACRGCAARRMSSRVGKPGGGPEGDGRSTLARTWKAGGFGRRPKVDEEESKFHHRFGKGDGRYGEGRNAGGLPQAETGRRPEGPHAARREYEGRFK